MRCRQRFWVGIACVFLGSWELGSVPAGSTRPLGASSRASEADSGRGNDGSDLELLPEQELKLVRESLLADRPYEKDYKSISEIITLKIFQVRWRHLDQFLTGGLRNRATTWLGFMHLP